jgi:hypothetical protein
MTRRILLGVGLLSAACVLAGLLMPPVRPGVTVGNFQRLREGMTEEQVEAILGRAADGREEYYSTPYSIWRGEDFTIAIHFGAHEPAGGASDGALITDAWKRIIRLRPRPDPW